MLKSKAHEMVNDRVRWHFEPCERAAGTEGTIVHAFADGTNMLLILWDDSPVPEAADADAFEIISGRPDDKFSLATACYGLACHLVGSTAPQAYPLIMTLQHQIEEMLLADEYHSLRNKIPLKVAQLMPSWRDIDTDNVKRGHGVILGVAIGDDYTFRAAITTFKFSGDASYDEWYGPQLYGVGLYALGIEPGAHPGRFPQPPLDEPRSPGRIVPKDQTSSGRRRSRRRA